MYSAQIKKTNLFIFLTNMNANYMLKQLFHLFKFQVHQALGLEALKSRTFQIFKASAIKGDGLDESMEWLSNALQARK